MEPLKNNFPKANESNQSNESNDILKNRDFRRSPEGWLLSFVGIGTCLRFYVLAALSSTYFSPFGRGLHSRVRASTRKLGCAFADARSGGAGRLVPLLCPDWYAAGLMTGSGWFDSAHGRQVYHFYPFTPLASRLGVVFCFPGKRKPPTGGGALVIIAAGSPGNSSKHLAVPGRNSHGQLPLPD